MVVQFTTEACALCPATATLKIEAFELLLAGYSHDQLSQKRL